MVKNSVKNGQLKTLNFSEEKFTASTNIPSFSSTNGMLWKNDQIWQKLLEKPSKII